MNPLNIAVIGGGAAGFFAALSCKTHHPDAQVTLFEKSDKLLAKVKVSGGGRCNVTHACFSNAQMVKFYPRGGSQLKKVFMQFSTQDTIQWFERRGVKLKTEADNRMFPVTNNSQTIIDCLMNETRKLGVTIKTNTPVTFIKKESTNAGTLLSIGLVPPTGKGAGLSAEVSTQAEVRQVDKIIIASGGSPKLAGFKWLEDLGHTIIPPVPSLFTFNMPQERIKELMGVSVENVTARIQGTKLMSEGPLLITHWGMSGPAILKLSSFGARALSEADYHFTVLINWLGNINEEKLREQISTEMEFLRKLKIANKNPFHLPNRLWLFFLEKLEIAPEKIWDELSKKELNKLMNLLTNDAYKVEGKTTFKEEFVTCGGVSLHDVNLETMESKTFPGLYFAGELLDIDALTGGFNFQAAWSTGFIAGKLMR